MSDGKTQQEPSMEEILASIRRIISEDTEPEGAGEGQPGDQPGGVLELTQMVQDDGSTIDLTQVDVPPNAAPSPDRDADTEPRAGAEPEPAAEPPSAPSATPEGEPPAPETEPVPGMEPAPGENDESEPLAAPEPAPEGDAEPESPPGMPSETAFEPEPTAAADAQAGAGPDDARPAPAPAGEADGVIAGASADASIDSLGDLARTMEPGPETVDELRVATSGRTVEDLVKEIMQPMLREWFDKNLPGLVERLVRKEIRNLVRRAEPD